VRPLPTGVEKTGANAFFVIQFIRRCRRGADRVRSDACAGAGIRSHRAKGFTDNVADLMAAKSWAVCPKRRKKRWDWRCLGHVAAIAAIELGPGAAREAGPYGALAKRCWPVFLYRVEGAYAFIHDASGRRLCAHSREPGPRSICVSAAALEAMSETNNREVFEIVTSFKPRRCLDPCAGRAEEVAMAQSSWRQARQDIDCLCIGCVFRPPAACHVEDGWTTLPFDLRSRNATGRSELLIGD